MIKEIVKINQGRIELKIRIAIVDDEIHMLNIIKKHIREVKELEDKIEVESFGNPEDFLARVVSGSDYDILLSDIEMNALDGLELGETVKQKHPDTFLIYVTAHEKYAAKSYYVNAYQYILKEEMSVRLPEVIKGCVNKILDEQKQYRIVANNNSFEKIFYKDIVYLKKLKSSKYVCYFTTNGEVKERTTIEQIMLELNSKEFVLVGRGYVVNINHINRIRGNTVYMDNGDEIVISQAKITAVKDQIHDYLGGV